MDTLIETISKDTLISIKPLSQTSSVLVKMFSAGKTHTLTVDIKTSPIYIKIAVTLSFIFLQTRAPPPQFLFNNTTPLLSAIGQLSQYL